MIKRNCFNSKNYQTDVRSIHYCDPSYNSPSSIEVSSFNPSYESSIHNPTTSTSISTSISSSSSGKPKKNIEKSFIIPNQDIIVLPATSSGITITYDVQPILCNDGLTLKSFSDMIINNNYFRYCLWVTAIVEKVEGNTLYLNVYNIKDVISIRITDDISKYIIGSLIVFPFPGMDRFVNVSKFCIINNITVEDLAVINDKMAFTIGNVRISNTEYRRLCMNIIKKNNKSYSDNKLVLDNIHDMINKYYSD